MFGLTDKQFREVVRKACDAVARKKRDMVRKYEKLMEERK